MSRAMAQSKTKKIAIACQGGGSHTAFTAGVLSIVLSPEYADRFDLIGFSGTSGGAVCTTLAWSGLISGLILSLARLAKCHGPVVQAAVAIAVNGLPERALALSCGKREQGHAHC